MVDDVGWSVVSECNGDVAPTITDSLTFRRHIPDYKEFEVLDSGALRC
jgi:hypothetical protein